ncbi:cation-translocating P-type ATPase [Roseovarius sp. S4756]|uniref:cation-translocating P-type ATPase n=1 Tax=Roseovarius maritimus TaxID=3342637 RepID=UPI0037262F64
MAGDPEMQAFAAATKEVLARVGTAPETGLSAEDVLARRKKYGRNELRQAKGKSALSILLHQFKSVIVWLLVVGAGFSIWLGDLVEAGAIIVVLIINSAIGFFTELRAEKSMTALRRIARVRTRVRRDGAERTLDAQELVPGDIVLIEEGDVITADLRLIEVADLHCDESVLTGESAPVVKDAGRLDPDTPLADRVNMAFKGSSVTRGRAEAVAMSTGMQTELGRISDLAQSAKGEVAPLERRLDRLGHRLVWLTLGLAAFTTFLGVLRGHALSDMIETGVALAVAAVPEGLPVVATLTLARGMWRMAARNALISNMPSVETLGATTIILTDKTGTLTENRMTANRYLVPEGDILLEERGKDTRFALNGENVSVSQSGALEQCLRIGALCNTATLDEGAGKAEANGDPMEQALLLAARSAGFSRDTLEQEYPQTGQHPFDPTEKMMATLHERDGQTFLAVKGAPEAVLAVCTHVMAKDGTAQPMEGAARAEWQARSEAAAREGLRLLGLASKTATSDNADPYDDLTLAGMVCLLDPIRADIPEAISAARRAGVQVIMMTGDHADTAVTIAGHAGLGNKEIAVLEEADLGDLETVACDGDEGRALRNTDVFARVQPETKLRLAAFFQRCGAIVAMTGDGVNDAPALKKADIGIAMGQRGTEVAREAADMVLKDDKFATIISAMQQGRVIFGNIRSFVVYLMSCNVSEILVVGLAVGMGLPAPLLPLQILFLNLVTDVFPAFALGLGRGDAAVMTRPPRDPAEGIVARDQWVLIGALGALITALTLGAFALALFWLRLDIGPAVTVSFLTLALAQLWNVFNMRKAGSSLIFNEVTRNPYVWGALALCLGLIAAALWLPGLSDILKLPDPGREGLALAFGVSLLQYILGQGIAALAAPAPPEGRAQ